MAIEYSDELIAVAVFDRLGVVAVQSLSTDAADKVGPRLARCVPAFDALSRAWAAAGENEQPRPSKSQSLTFRRPSTRVKTPEPVAS